jgi:nucleobase:cation symporter-1, NCS1 family
VTRDDTVWERDPVYGTMLENAEIAVLWASVALGFPALYAGSRLAATEAEGGFGFGTVELVLAVVLGAVIGALVLGIAAWATANVAVPGDILLRPAFGRWGSIFVSVVIALVLVMMAAVELRAAAGSVNQAVFLLEGPNEAVIGWVVAALAAAAMAWAGLALVTRVWFRRVAVWGALVASLFLLWRLWGDSGLSSGAGAGRFMQGVDSVAGVALLLFPLLPFVVRFSGAPAVAATVTTTAYAAPALLLPLLGAAAAASLGPSTDPAAVAAGLAGATGGTAVIVIMLVWVVTAQVDQPYLFGLAAAGWGAGALDRRGNRSVVLAVVAVAVAVGAAVPADEYAGIVGLGVAVMVPVVAVFFADFFVLRARSYNSDALYDVGGTYRGVNALGLVAGVVGFLIYQWILPTGPSGFERFVFDVIPGGRSLAGRFGDLPPGVIAFAVTFVLYSGLGRLLVREEVSVSRIAGRF